MPAWPAFPGQSTELFHYSGIRHDNKPQIFFSAAPDVPPLGWKAGREAECFPCVEETNQTGEFWFLLHVCFE